MKNRFGGGAVKVDDVLDFPEKGLVLQVGHPAMSYDLFAVVNHMGAEIQNGHYFAYVKEADDGRWMYANEETANSNSYSTLLAI